MTSSLAAALVGLSAYALYGAGLVLMKRGASALSRWRLVRREAATRRSLLLWLAGVALNFGYAAVLTVALGLGPASLVGALNGFSLVIIAGLSRLLLGEHLTRRGWWGLSAIVLGVVPVSLGSTPEDLSAVELSAAGSFLLAASALVAVVYGLALWRGGHRRAAWLGGCAGALGGIAILLQKIFAGPLLARAGSPQAGLLHVLVHPAFYLWMLAASLSFAALQHAYGFGRAVDIGPPMVSLMILVPIAGGVWGFHEPFAAHQLLGAALIVGGVFALGAAEGHP